MKLSCPIFIGLAIGLFATGLGACVGPTFIVQQYSGPTRPTDAVATLRVNGSDSIRLLTLDEENITVPIASDSRLHVEMLPGRHTLTVRDVGAPDRLPEAMGFQAEAGKVYRVAGHSRASNDATAGNARVYEVDRAGDTPTRDVTLPDAAEGP